MINVSILELMYAQAKVGLMGFPVAVSTGAPIIASTPIKMPNPPITTKIGANTRVALR